jgi:hypothetical protein
MFVILYEAGLMDVRMRVGLPAVAVLVLVLNVLVLVQDVRVCMCYILVAVLVSVLRGHPSSIPGRSIRRGPPPYSNRSGLVNRCYTSRPGCWQVLSAKQLNARNVQLAK